MPTNPLQLKPYRADQKIDPTDPDVIGTIASKTGEALDAIDLIARGTAQYAQLTPILNRPVNVERTQTLDEAEVRDAIMDDAPDGFQFPDGGAAVRGREGQDLFVTYVLVSPGGRSTRGVMPYKELSASRRAFDEKQRRTLEAARAARAAGGDEEQFGEDPRVETLSAEITRLERERDEAKRAAEAAAGPPEPFEGYADAKAGDIIARIEGEQDVLERELLKRRVREFESAGENRVTVIRATEPAPLVEASDAQSGSDAPTPSE